MVIDMFSVDINGLNRIGNELNDISHLLSDSARRVNQIYDDMSNDFSFKNCRIAIESISRRTLKQSREMKELQEILRAITNCYRDCEEEILEYGIRVSKVQAVTLKSFKGVHDKMESLNIKFS